MAHHPTLKPAHASPAGSASASVGLRKGRSVPIPSSAVPALEQAHGPGRVLCGKVKVEPEYVHNTWGRGTGGAVLMGCGHCMGNQSVGGS